MDEDVQAFVVVVVMAVGGVCLVTGVFAQLTSAVADLVVNAIHALF